VTARYCTDQSDARGPRRSIVPTAFTLLEVIVALSIMAIALVALLRLHVVSITMADRAARLSRAALLADAKMAEVLSQDYPEIGSQSGSTQQEERDVVFHWQVTIDEVKPAALEDVGLTGLRSVCAQVTWQEGLREGRVQVATYVSDKR